MLSPNSFLLPKLRGTIALLLLSAAAHAQDVYFSQPFGTRLHTNPAFTGLLDDYSVTLAYRNQLPTLIGTFQSFQLAGDIRLDRPGQHHAIGLLINQDRTGSLGYNRLEIGGLYAYHTRLNKQYALSGGIRTSYGRQHLSNQNFVFGDQFNADGTSLGPSAESLDFAAVNYFSVGTGVVLYSDKVFFSLAGQHLNQPNLGFRGKSSLPLLLNLSAGYKYFAVKPGQGRANRELSYMPVVNYARQGGSQRLEAGLYVTATPVTLGAVYRNILLPSGVGTQQVVAIVAGIQTGGLRLGYSYDIALSQLNSELGGAHEVTIAVHAFDKLENAHRRLKRRDYPLAPCPAF